MSDELVTEETMNKWASLFGVVTENAIAGATQAANAQTISTKVEVADQQCKLAMLEAKVMALESKQQQLILLLMQISANKLSPEEINKQLLKILE